MLIVSPLYAVEGLARQFEDCHVLGLLGPDHPHPDLPEVPVERRLKLVFNDISMPVDGMTMAGERDIATLIDFVQTWRGTPGPMIIHCWAGISRSTAAAYTAMCALRPTIDERDLAAELRGLSAPATPNRHIVALADRLLGRDGRMSEAIASIGRGAEAYEGNVFMWEVDR